MSKLQLYSVMTVGTLVYVYTYAINSLMLNCGTAGWLSTAGGCTIWLITMIIASYFIKQSGHKKLSELIYDCLGDFFGMVVNCLVSIAVILSMSERLYECIRLMKLYGYTNTPAIVIAAVIMVVAFYCGKAGHTAVAKTAVPVVFALIIGIVIVMISGIGQYDVGNIYPIFGYNAANTIKGGIWTLSATDNILIGLVFAENISKKQFRHSGIAASVTAFAAYTVCALCYSLAFPYSATQNNTSGIIDIARGTENGGFFQRFESILLFIVIIGMICFIAIYLSAAVKQIDDTFSIKKRRSWILSAALAAAVAIIALIPDNSKVNDGNLLQWYRQYSFVFILAVGIILLIGGIIKRNFVKKAAVVATILGITLSMCSCGDYREVENEAYAVMIGIDSGDTEMGYSYTVRLMNGEKILTSVSQSLYSAISDISQMSSIGITLKNLRILAISQELAEDGILKFTEPIVKDTDTKNGIMLAICSESAEKFVSSKRFDSMQEIELTVNNMQSSPYYEPESVNNVYNCIYSTGKDASAAYVINGDDEEEDKISGTAIFAGEKMVGVLDGDETAMIKAINGNLNGLPLVFEDREYMISSEKKAKIGFSGDTGEISVFLRCTDAGKSTDKLPDNVRVMLTKRLTEAMNDIKEAGADIIGLGQYAAKQYSTIDSFEQSGWKQKFKTITIKAKLVV